MLREHEKKVDSELSLRELKITLQSQMIVKSLETIEAYISTMSICRPRWYEGFLKMEKKYYYGLKVVWVPLITLGMSGESENWILGR